MDGASLGSPRGEIILDAAAAMSALRQFGQAAQTTMQGVGQNATAAQGGFSGFAAALGSPAIQQAGGLLAGVGAAVATVGGFAINSAMQFEQGMANVSAATGATGDELDSLSDAALRIGKDTSFSATEATLAIEELAKAGVSTENILDGAADATVGLAAAGGVALPEAATVMSAALNQFGLKAGEASGYTDEFGKSVNNAAHVADVIAGAASASATGVSEMGASLSYVGTSAAALGVPIEDTTTALALMANQGIVGSSAGTSLNQALLSLANPTTTAAGVMQELGLSFTDMNGNMLPLPDIISQVATATEGMGTSTRAAYLEQLFGVEGGKAMNALLASQDEALAGTTGSWDGMHDAVTEVGVAQEQAQARLNSTQGRLEGLKGSLETAAIVIGSKLLPAFDGLIVMATNVLGAFLNLPSGMQTVIAAVVGVAGALAGIGGTAILLAPRIMSAVQSFKALSIAMRALSLSNPVFLAIAAAVGIALLAIAAYKTNFLGFGDAVRAVAGVIGDAIGGILHFFQDFGRYIGAVLEDGDTLNDWLTHIPGPLQGIAKAFGEVVATIKGWVDKLLAPFKTFKKVFDDLTKPIGVTSETLAMFGIAAEGASRPVDRLAAFITALKTAFPALAGPIDMVVGAFQAVADKARFVIDMFQMARALGADPLTAAIGALSAAFPILSGVLSSVGDMVRAVGDVFRGLYDAITAAFSGDWEGVVQGLKDAVMGVWDYVKAAFGLWTEIGSLVLQAFDAIPWGVIGSALVTGFLAAWDALKAGASNLWDWVKDTVADIDWGAVGGALRDGAVAAIGMIGDAAAALLEWGRGLIQGAWDGAVEKWGEFTGWVGGLLADLDPGDLAGPFRTAFNAIGTAIDVAWLGISMAWDTVKGWATTIAEKLGIPDLSAFLTPISLIGNAVSMAWELISPAWDAIKTWAGEIVSHLGAPDFSSFTAPIAQIAATIGTVWTAIKTAWDSVVSWATGLVASLGGAPDFTEVTDPIAGIANCIDTAWSAIQTAWLQISGFVTRMADGLSIPSFEDLCAAFQTIATGISDAWDDIETAWESITGWIDGIDLSVPSFGDVIAAFYTIGQGVQQAWTLIKNAWDDITGWLDGLLDGITVPNFDTITSAFQSFSDTITPPIDWVIDKLGAFVTFLQGLKIPDIDLPDLTVLKFWTDDNGAVSQEGEGDGGASAGDTGPSKTPAVTPPPAAVGASATAIAEQVKTAATDIRTALQQIMTDVTNMKVGVVQDFTDMTSTVAGVMLAFQSGVPPIVTSSAQTVMTDVSNMKIGVVADFTDTVTTTLTLVAGWSSSMGSASSSLATSVMSAISRMKIGVVADVNDTQATTLGVFGGWQTGMTAIASRLDSAVRQSVSQMKIGAVADISDMVNTAIARVGAMQSALVGQFNSLTSQVIAQSSNLRSQVTGTFETIASQAAGAVQRMASAVVGAFQSMIGQAVGAVQSLAGSVLGTLNGLAGSAGGAGQNIGNQIGAGIANGISGWVGSIANAAASAVNAAISAARSAAAIHSPSQVARDDVGAPISQGIAVGIQRAARTVAAAAAATVTGAIRAARDEFRGFTDLKALTDYTFKKYGHWTPESLIRANEISGTPETGKLNASKLYSYTENAMEGDWANDFGAWLDRDIQRPLFKLGEQLESMKLDPQLLEAVNDAAWAIASGYDAASSLSKIPDRLDQYVINLGKAIGEVNGTLAQIRPPRAPGEAVNTTPQTPRPPRSTTPSLPTLPSTLPPVMSPLPSTPSYSGGGGGITINMGGFQITASGGAAESASQWGDAFTAEVPAIAAAIRRQLGG